MQHHHHERKLLFPTYVINLSRYIKDEHGVELSDAISLAYSTGNKISKGSISFPSLGEDQNPLDHCGQLADHRTGDGDLLDRK